MIQEATKQADVVRQAIAGEFNPHTVRIIWQIHGDYALVMPNPPDPDCLREVAAAIEEALATPEPTAAPAKPKRARKKKVSSEDA